MKTIVKNFAYSVLVIAGAWLFPQQIFAQEIDTTLYDNSAQNNDAIVQNNAPDQNQPVTLQVFYDELSPYGTWINDPNLGYVWSPNVDQNFRPYVTNGHWVNTDYGWTWVSDFSWGWAPFHYGRWTVDPQYGNIWIPDTVWGPAWVSWRQSDGYVGWTPMGPGVDINYALGSSYYVPYDRWNFVRDRDFMQYDLFGYCLGRSLINSIFNTSYLIRGTRYDNYRRSSYFYGPSREYIQRYAGRVINPVHIRDNNRPGQSYANGYLNLYRPQMQRGNSYGRNVAPRSLNNNMAGRNVQNNYRSNSNPNRTAYSPARGVQVGQQPNQNSYRSQGIQQPSRYTNSGSQGRGIQTAQQPNQNSYRSQGAQQPSRYTNSGSQGRSVQTAQQPNQNSYRSQGVQQPSRYTNSGSQGRGIQTAQQPNQNSYRSQGVQNPTRYAVSNNQGRSAQPAYQQRNQREERAVQNVQSNNRQQGSRMTSNASSQRSQPSSSQREGNSRGSSNNDRGRR